VAAGVGAATGAGAAGKGCGAGVKTGACWTGAEGVAKAAMAAWVGVCGEPWSDGCGWAVCQLANACAGGASTEKGEGAGAAAWDGTAENGDGAGPTGEAGAASKGEVE